MSIFLKLLLLGLAAFGANKYIDQKIEHNNDLQSCIQNELAMTGFYDPIIINQQGQRINKVMYCNDFCIANLPHFDINGKRISDQTYEELSNSLKEDNNCMHACLLDQESKAKQKCLEALNNGDSEKRKNWFKEKLFVIKPVLNRLVPWH